jgi:hypothetical protein
MDLTDKENPEFRVRLSFSYMELTNLLGTSMQLEINNVDYSGLKQQYNCQRIASIGIYRRNWFISPPFTISPPGL